MKIKYTITMLSACLPLWIMAADPVLVMPLDGSADVMNAKGEKIAAGTVYGPAEYLPGIGGKALDVRRYAPDSVTALVFDKLPAMDCSNGTVAFWFQPHWQENDLDPCCILFGNDIKWKGFMFYLLKTKTAIELSVCAPKQIQILKKDLFQANQWTHVAFTWNQEKSEVKLYLDGKEVAARTVPGAFQPLDPMKIVVACGRDNNNQSKANVGNALYGDIKIFDRALAPDEIAALLQKQTE